MAQPYTQPCDHGVIEAEPCPREAGREVSPQTRRIVLTACILASSMAFIDGSALTVALPALKADFDTGLATVQWVVNGYVLALAALTMAGGAMADIFGKQRMLIIGCIAFGAASAACALAPDPLWLIIARIAQGAAAAILTPASLALIGAVYPKEERGAAIGAWAAASALTTAGGPALGGWLTETFGWQSIFWINPPIAAAAVALLLLSTPSVPRQDRRFDIPGAAILALSLAGFAWGLSEVGPGEAAHLEGAVGATPWPFILFVIAASLAGSTAFAFWEKRTDHPMIPPRLFQDGAFTGLNAATLMIYLGLSIMFFVLPFELIEQREITPTEAGLAFLPFTLGMGIFSRLFGGLADTIGARKMLIAGAAATAASFLLFVFLREQSLWLGVIFPMAVLGVAFSVIVAPLTAAVMSTVEPSDEGLASGVNNTASRIAQMTGVALAAGLATFPAGFVVAMSAAAAAALVGAVIVYVTVPGKKS